MEEASWVGKAVSIHCTEHLGVFQGTIKDLSSDQLTIVRAFRNGVPLKKQDAEVTLRIGDIMKIDLIPYHNAQNNVGTSLINNPTPVKQPNFGAASSAPSTSRESALTYKMSNMKMNGVQRRSPTTDNKNANGKQMQMSKSPSNVNVAKFFGMLPSTVESKLVQAAPYQQDNGRSSSKPIDIVNSARSAPTNTPFRQQDRKKSRRNNKNHTFGTPVDDPIMGEDFDFEGNLKLFDKQAVYDAIEAGQKPDLVRQTLPSQQKYRHDENVIATTPMQYRQIESGYQSTHEFVTDEGLIIPAIPYLQRSQIQLLAERNGLTSERQCDMLARGTSDLAILLLGGARRLNPNNEHQWPRIVIICDKKSDNAKACEVAAATGRQLASHGLKVILYIKEEDIDQNCIELKLFKATGNRIVSSLNELPSSDLVILSLTSDVLPTLVKKWIIENRSSVLAIDPRPNGIPDVQIKCSILPILPLNNTSSSCGKLYLCNLGIPDKFFQDSGITYKSPFGHKFVIPIHMKD